MTKDEFLLEAQRISKEGGSFGDIHFVKQDFKLKVTSVREYDNGLVDVEVSILVRAPASHLKIAKGFNAAGVSVVDLDNCVMTAYVDDRQETHFGDGVIGQSYREVPINFCFEGLDAIMIGDGIVQGEGWGGGGGVSDKAQLRVVNAPKEVYGPKPRPW